MVWRRRWTPRRVAGMRRATGRAAARRRLAWGPRGRPRPAARGRRLPTITTVTRRRGVLYRRKAKPSGRFPKSTRKRATRALKLALEPTHFATSAWAAITKRIINPGSASLAYGLPSEVSAIDRMWNEIGAGDNVDDRQSRRFSWSGLQLEYMWSANVYNNTIAGPVPGDGASDALEAKRRTDIRIIVVWWNWAQDPLPTLSKMLAYDTSENVSSNTGEFIPFQLLRSGYKTRGKQLVQDADSGLLRNEATRTPCLWKVLHDEIIVMHDEVGTYAVQEAGAEAVPLSTVPRYDYSGISFLLKKLNINLRGYQTRFDDTGSPDWVPLVFMPQARYNNGNDPDKYVAVRQKWVRRGYWNTAP